MRDAVLETKYSYLKNKDELLSCFLLGKIKPWLTVYKLCLQFLPKPEIHRNTKQYFSNSYFCILAAASAAVLVESQTSGCIMTWQVLVHAGGKVESLYIKTGYHTEWDHFLIEVSWNFASLWFRTWTSPPQKASSCLLSSMGRANALLSSVKTCRWVQGKVRAWPCFHQAFKDKISLLYGVLKEERGCSCWLGRGQARISCFLSSVNRKESDPGCSSVDVTWLSVWFQKNSSSTANLGEF